MKATSYYIALISICSTFMFAMFGCDELTPASQTEGQAIGLLIHDIDSLSLMADALEQTAIAEELREQGQYTLFAPTNTAMEDYLETQQLNELEELPPDELLQLVLNHIVQDTLKGNKLATGYIRTVAEVDSIGTQLSNYLFVDSLTVQFNDSRVLFPGFIASNGLIYPVDGVVEMPTVLTLIESDTTYSSLNNTLNREAFNNEFNTLLSGSESSPFTLFAPTNQAFEALLEELNLNTLSEVSDERLKDILNMHLLTESQLTSNQIRDTTQLTTRGGSRIQVNTENGFTLVDEGGRAANFSGNEQQTINGIIHGIDAVLLPEE